MRLRTLNPARARQAPPFADQPRDLAAAAQFFRLALFLCLTGAAAAGVVDRVAVVVGKTVFTESEVEQEARLTQFESGKPLDLSPVERKQAADQLVDQELLRQEMSATGFEAATLDAAAILRDYRRKHSVSDAQLQASLARYGLTGDALEQRLAWEVTLLHFTDQRFKPLAALSEESSANRADNSAQPVAAAPLTPSTSAVDQQMDAWLQQRKQDTRIVYIPEAFQ